MFLFKHAFVILLTLLDIFSGVDHSCLLGEWRIPGNLFLKSFRLLIYDWLCIKQYHMCLPYDYILSLSDVTKFCSLRNVYVLNPSPSTLVTKVSCPQQCVSSILTTE